MDVDMNSETQNNALYCNMDVFTPDERESHIQATTRLFQSVQSIHEVGNGYEFVFPNHGAESITAFAEFISNERRCCSFLEFTLRIPSNDKSISLLLTGPEGTQEFLREEFSEAFHENIS
jgi:hypothetical protein